MVKELYNGIKIPVIGMGTFPQKDSLMKSVPEAYKMGYRMFDTSDNYYNEDFYGNAYQDICSQGEFEGITITKFSFPLMEWEDVFEHSINKIFRGQPRTKLIYLLHWPYPYLYQDIWHFMEELYISHKCDAIGVCNFEIEHLEKLMGSCRIKPIINQFECHPGFRQDSLCKFCTENDISIMSYSPLARMNDYLYHNDILEKIAKRYAKSISQVILRWNIDSGRVVIPGSSNPIHLKENIEVFDFKLSEDELEMIDLLDSGMRIRYDPKTRFSSEEQGKMYEKYKMIHKRETYFV